MWPPLEAEKSLDLGLQRWGEGGGRRRRPFSWAGPGLLVLHVETSAALQPSPVGALQAGVSGRTQGQSGDDPWLSSLSPRVPAVI